MRIADSTHESGRAVENSGVLLQVESSFEAEGVHVAISDTSGSLTIEK